MGDASHAALLCCLICENSKVSEQGNKLFRGFCESDLTANLEAAARFARNHKSALSLSPSSRPDDMFRNETEGIRIGL